MRTSLLTEENIPTRTLPAAPIPVHTAYPVPTGNSFIATDKRKKLSAPVKTVKYLYIFYSKTFRQLHCNNERHFEEARKIKIKPRHYASPPCPSASFSPTIPTSSSVRKNNFPTPALFTKYKNPTIAVPSAPIPVKIAYAVPIGISSMAFANKKKLTTMKISVIIEGKKTVKPCASFSPIAQIISVIPAMSQVNPRHIKFPSKMRISIPSNFLQV